MPMQKLLIVDDQPEIRKMLRFALAGRQYRLLEAANGEDALALARSARPDVMLLDVMMPGRYNGFDVCKILKSEPVLAHTFVVMLTARGLPGDYDESCTAGADAYLVKPCTLGQLIGVVEARAHPGRPIYAHRA